MPFLEKLRSIFTSEGKRKLKQQSYSRQDVDPSDLWEILGELGDGAFGKVYKAKNKAEDYEAALKLVEIKNETDLEEFSIEIDILRLCKHKNVVSLFESYIYANKLWMYMEFCGGGALDSIMIDLEKGLTEPQIQYVCRQMCEGLDFLHQNFVIHRDLKAGNVLLTIDGQVKLADFGVSAKNTSFVQTRGTFIGTPYWMAPEVILCETIKDCPYTFKADIWSFGITLIELAEIQPPNYDLHPLRVLIKIQKGTPPVLRIPKKWSPGFRDFIAKCLVKDPGSRPNAAELLEHPFISNVSCNDPVLELLSEVKAEVVLEEDELDDDTNDDDSNGMLTEDDSSGDLVGINDTDSVHSLSVKMDETEETENSIVKVMLTKRQNEAESKAGLGDSSAFLGLFPSCDVQQPSAGNSDETVEESDKNILEEPQPDDNHVNELQSLEPDAQLLTKTAKDEELEPPLNYENQLGSELPVDDETLTGQFEAEAKNREDEKLPNVSATHQSTADSRANDLSLESITGVEMLNENVGVGIESERNEGEDFQESMEIQYICSKSNGEVDSNADKEWHLKEMCDDVSFERGFDAELDNKVIAICDNSDEQKDIFLVGNDLCSDSNSDEIKNQIQTEDHFEPKSEYASNTKDDIVIKKCLLDEGIHANHIENDKIGNLSIDDEYTRVNHNDDHNKRYDHDVNDEENHQTIDHSNEENHQTIDHSNEQPRVCDEDRSDIEHTSVNPDQDRRTEDRRTDVCEFKDVVDCSEVELEESKCDIEGPASLIFDNSAVHNHISFESQDDEDIKDTTNQSVNNVLEQPDPIHVELCSLGNKNISLSVATDNCLNDVKTNISTDTAKDSRKSGEMTKFEQNKTKKMADEVDISTATEVTSDPVTVAGSKVNSEDEEKTITPEDQRTRFRTLTKTRTFVVNGVVMKSQSSRVVLNGTENRKQQEHDLWKADLRELRRLQKEENRQLQLTDVEAQTALDELAKRQRTDMQALHRTYDLELDQLGKQRMKVLDKMIASQVSEYKSVQKKVKTEQERDVKRLHESLKQERKLWKQGLEMLPKPSRKEMMSKKREEKEIELAEKERNFLEEQHEKSELSLKRLSDQHRDKIVLLDKQFLQQKHQILKVRLSRIMELEERHMKEKYEISFLQLKNKFILKRNLMMQRNNREVDQMKRINNSKIQQLLQQQAFEFRRLPKTLKSDAKTRQLMYKESLRISYCGATAEQEKVKIKEFQENEKNRRKQEIARVENKHKRQLGELNARNDARMKELEEMHVEKQTLLSEYQEQKEKDLKSTYNTEMAEWKSTTGPRCQTFEEECSSEIVEHESFYSQEPGAILRVNSQRSLTGSLKSGRSVKSHKSLKASSYRSSLIM